jgi:hypothetical protein
MRPEPPGGSILHVRRPDADFRLDKATFRPIHEAEAPDPKTRPDDPRGRPGSSCVFSGDFSGGISGFSGGFSMKILGVISYSL